ncbi:MAG: hypothetical protein LBO21_10350, partial [Synergistaceae bacterium]|nr:hypothetical protein [Synergistaceae bacterium]
MIADFHIHYAPEVLVKKQLGNESFKLVYSNGIPSYSFHPKLHQVEKHVEVLEHAGIDRAYISSAPGMEGGDLEICKLINNDLFQWEKRFPSKIKGMAHIPPLGGKEAFAELHRAVHELGYEGAAMGSNVEGHD